ncbi:hypothetical protein, partial [Ensifer sp. ENS12]|uniref:hypothetical protein n=1 Tax=Ensifer sp. ENS12 TaxID=2854774 RepID=UPI001C474B39
TAKVSFRKNPFEFLTSSAAHVSLSLYSIVKKPTNSPSVKPFPTSPKLASQTPKSASANQGNSRAKVVVASSAAALVSDRAYRPPASKTSTAIFKKTSKKNKPLNLKDNFDC